MVITVVLLALIGVGSGVDLVSFGATTADMRFTTFLFEGDDTFTLDTTAIMLSGHLDGGEGQDTFVDNIGEPYPFPFSVVNVP